MIWSKAFWKGAAERAIKTVAQSTAAVIAVGTTGLFDVEWPVVASIAGAAGLASILTSIGNADFVAGATQPDNLVLVAPAKTRG